MHSFYRSALYILLFSLAVTPSAWGATDKRRCSFSYPPSPPSPPELVTYDDLAVVTDARTASKQTVACMEAFLRAQDRTKTEGRIWRPLYWPSARPKAPASLAQKSIIT